MKNYKIAVAGTGYVGLSIATLLSQHHQVTAVDIVPEKVELINNRKSPIQDDYMPSTSASEKSCLTAPWLWISTSPGRTFSPDASSSVLSVTDRKSVV